MKKKGVLIIHGFVGNPNEVSFLSERLEKQGYIISVPLLPGHGQGNKPLQKVKATEWINAVEKAYLELEKSCDCVFVVGFSMGGLLAAHLWNFKMTGLVTVNTPVYYWNLKQIIFNLTSDYTKYSLKYLNSGKGKPLNAMAQFQKLLFFTIPVFKRLNCNTLVLQAADDDTVVPKSSDYIFSRITGEKHLIKLAKGGHQIFQSERAQEASLIIERYFENLS
ncbi:MAG: PhoPQ-activated protein PqaA family protein [Anaerovorax sp.]|nr:PhoPQ-activated protein PqaA family protein [Anaerovorax sp.]